jgi:hypothetical protein
VLGHDDPAPGLSQRGLVTVVLTAVVVVLLTIHRRYGSGSLVRAVIEYAVVALLGTLLAPAAGGTVVDQQPIDRPTRVEGQAQAAAGGDQPAVLRVGAKVVRGVTGAARAVAGAVRWLVDLWRQADQQARPPKGEAMAASPGCPTPLPASSVLSLRRCL